jgi:hypothetical protein
LTFFQISCDVTGEKNPSVPAAKLGDAQFNNYWAAVTDLSLAYYYTEDPAYARRAAFLTRQFFFNSTTRMNPNVNYGQMWPGVCRSVTPFPFLRLRFVSLV